MWFDTWGDLIRIAVLGTASYAVAVIVLRVGGKRTLTQLSAFDLVVTVALGSVLATILLSSTVSLAEGALALALLVALQFVVALGISRSRLIQRLAKARATLLLEDGEFLDHAMRRHRLTREDVRAAIRDQGIGDVARVAAVVLEANGRITVVSRDQLGDGSALPSDELDRA